MERTSWILLDTETTALSAPIFVVELGAQRMCGWEPQGAPFRKLLNQNQNIPPEASRVHGYTREILERDGAPALEVYEEFREYVGGLPLVCYNADYDLRDVLRPEWRRLGVEPIGSEGFCALRLTQRLLDPVPAGNCKLQTLRQYYHLPERGAHTALGDVLTVADLFAHVLRPIAEQRRLTTWEKLAAYAAEEWYPSRIAFGKYKGRSVWEARQDVEMRQWLEWLAQSSNARSSRMGKWYLRELEGAAMGDSADAPLAWECPMPGGVISGSRAGTDLVVYVNPELVKLCALVEGARTRLAELEATFTKEKIKVDALQATLFRKLQAHYRKRDQLRLIVRYRQKYLDVLLREGEEEAEKVSEDFQREAKQTERDYEQAATEMAKKKELSPDEAAEVSRLWRELVKLYHPDRFAQEPEKLAAYQKLSSAINHARDTGDIETLRQIAADPQGFILRQGWGSLDFGDARKLGTLRKLWESLQLEIVAVLERLNRLHESPEYELHRLVERKPELLETVAAESIAKIQEEIAALQSQADELDREIEELSGQTAGI